LRGDRGNLTRKKKLQQTHRRLKKKRTSNRTGTPGNQEQGKCEKESGTVGKIRYLHKKNGGGWEEVSESSIYKWGEKWFTKGLLNNLAGEKGEEDGGVDKGGGKGVVKS